MEIAVPRADGEAASADGFEVAAQEEMNVTAGVGELRAVVPAEGAGTDDAVAEVGFHESAILKREWDQIQPCGGVPKWVGLRGT